MVGWLCCVLVLSACGHSLPTAGEELLRQKRAVLVISGAGLDDASRSRIDSVLQSWNHSYLITYEAMPKVEALDDAIFEQIQGKPYDYVFVVGNELLPAAAQMAARKTDSRWVLLQDRIGSESYDAAHAMVWKFDRARLDQAWNGWVQEQVDAGAALEWITTQEAPVPVQWAPSEEADHILTIDLYGDAWFDQLTYQVKQNKPRWIVLYSPIAESALKKVRTLRIPIFDMTSSQSLALNWDLVWQQQLDMILNNSWKPGVYSYADEQVSVSAK